MKIIKFSAEWCGPCKVLAPVFHNVSELEEFKDITFEEVDVDDEEKADLISEMKIRNVPTIIFLNEYNEPIKRIVGSTTEQNLVQLIRTELENAK
jgi:thioredoxin 1